jgi:hypothetical protein
VILQNFYCAQGEQGKAGFFHGSCKKAEIQIQYEPLQEQRFSLQGIQAISKILL